MFRLRNILWISTTLVLLTSACATSSTNWFGIDVPEKGWEVETIENAPHSLGAVRHRSIENCRIVLMDDEPIYVAGNPAGWEVNYQEEETEALRIFLVTAKDADGQVAMQFYDVIATSGPEGGIPGRLAYYQVEGGEDATACLDAFHELLISIDPATFPELEIPEG